MAIGRVNTGGGGSGGTLTVTGIAGHTVTATKGGKTYTRTLNSSGVAVFKGLSTGTWTLTMTGDGQTATRTVDVNADYAVTITYFSATINITYPANSNCVVTNSGGTTVASDTNTGSSTKTWTATVGATGTYTVTATATDGSGKTKSTTVSITADGQSESVTLPYDLVLYSVGNMHTETGGNWTTSDYSRAGWGNFTNVPPENTNEGLSINPGTQICVFGKENKVDLTKYSKLSFTVVTNTTEQPQCFVTGTKSLMEESNSVANIRFYNQTGEITIDISSISGSYYVAFAFYTGKCLIEEVKLT